MLRGLLQNTEEEIFPVRFMDLILMLKPKSRTYQSKQYIGILNPTVH
jgi:hypothetical protein